MDFSQLDSLMSINKKGDTSKEKKNQFNQLLKSFIAENGYSQQSEKYLYEGFPFCGSKPISEYLAAMKSVDERSAFFSDMTKGKMFYTNNKGISFKILISLLGYLMKVGVDDMSLFKSIINKIPSLSVNKEGKRWSDISKTVEKYFVCILSVDSMFPNLKNMDLMPALIDKFSLLMSDALNGISDSPKNALVIQKILAWLSNGNEEDFFVAETKAEKAIIITNERPNPPKSKADELRIIADYISLTEKKCATLEKRYELLQCENSSLKRDVEKSSAHLKHMEETILELTTQKDQYSSQISTLQLNLRDANATIKDITEELQKRNTVLSTFESYKQNSQQEQLNSIASNLKAEYKDFIDALSMDMTVELGDNMRQQLSTIFKILLKNGIDIERRF